MIRKVSVALNLPYASVSRWTRLLSTFVAGQGAVQLIQLLSGFLLIRWLSVEEYAQYSIAFAFQSTAQMLVEFGFSGAIVALVGDRIHDKKMIGNYIKAGRFYRNRFFIVVGAGCLILFPLLMVKHEWPLSVTVLLLVCILSNLYFSGNISYYISPLKIHQKLSDLYQIQVKNGLLRLFLIIFFYISSVLNAWLAALSTSILTIANGTAFKKKANTFVDEPGYSSVEVRREMFEYLRPIMPGIIFTAFQGQIMVFIISIFGQTENIAEIGALGRLGQLFLMLNLAGGIIVAPYFARQQSNNLIRKFLLVVLLSGLISLIIWLFSYLFSDLLILIIGSKYHHLQTHVPLLVGISCIGFVNSIMWAIITSRKWLWWWMPVLNISGIIIIQIICVFTMDLSTTHNVLMFSLFSSCFIVLHRVIVSTYGLAKN